MDPADFYSGIVVDAYASLKSSTFDPVPYQQLVRTHGEPALEIGCGDGQPLLDLCAAGLDVDGVDSSLDMVQRCREHAEQRGVRTRVFHQRVESLDLSRRYATIYFAGPTFNLLATDATALGALRAIRDHLTSDGVAHIPLWVPERTPERELGVTRTSRDGAGAELRYTPLTETFDREQRTRTTVTRYERVTTEGSETVSREWIIHWHTPASVRRLCARADLEVVHLLDDATHEPASPESDSFTLTVGRPAADPRLASRSAASPPTLSGGGGRGR